MNQQQKKTRKRGFLAKNPEGLKLIEQALRDNNLKCDSKSDKYDELAKIAECSPDTIKNLLNPHFGNKVGQDIIIKITNKLNLEPENIVEDWYSESNQTIRSENENQYIIEDHVFQQMLDDRLTTNPLTKNHDYTIHDIWIPLGLELIKNKDELIKKKSSSKKESVLDRSTEYEMREQFTHDEFLSKIFLNGGSEKSQRQRIAIIGQPGVGKTTQLQKIGDFLLKNDENSSVIFVSLADLQGKNLEDYLLNTWLKDALK